MKKENDFHPVNRLYYNFVDFLKWVTINFIKPPEIFIL